MKRAFTLIELLVVVLIIGILAAIALPQYQKSVMKTKAAAQLAQVDAFLKAQKVYFLENNSYTQDLDALSIETRTGDMYWTCGESYYIYCDIHPYINSVLFWNTNLEKNGSQKIYCVAKSTDDLANSICKSYSNDPDNPTGGPWKSYSVPR